MITEIEYLFNNGYIWLCNPVLNNNSNFFRNKILVSNCRETENLYILTINDPETDNYLEIKLNRKYV